MTILACGCDTEHKIPRGEVYQGCPEHASVRCDGCQECNYSCETHVFPPKPESTEGRPWGQPLKKPAVAPLNLG